MTGIASLTNQAVRQLQAPHAFPSPKAKVTNATAAIDGSYDAEETYTIKCACDYDDDDGDTVECEKCLTWQHIVCYYPSYPARPVPEQHKCCDCDPSRLVDKKQAHERQRLIRMHEAQQVSDRKIKRPPAKGHKKKGKEPSTTNQTNGWILQNRHDSAHGCDRKSGSPRDQPPPAKKPKITHRPSVSIHSAAGALSSAGPRKRKESVSHARESPTGIYRSLDAYSLPGNYFSPEFIFLHRNKSQFVEAPANLYLSIGVTNDLSTWLNDPEALAEATNGKAPRDIFQRCTQPIEDIPMPQIVKEVHENPDMVFHGHHPSWHYLTVPSGVAAGGFVGELKGRVGRLEDYKDDPANRWEVLQHPEPFVFFHPQLPIYIDARCEGNMLRYVRRSCRPNLEMKTLITEGRECRFCFVAKEEISPNEEITVGWNVEPILPWLPRLHTGNLGQVERGKVCSWVGGVLANFGGCACDQDENTCGLAPLDHRADAASLPNEDQDVKEHKVKKSRKARNSPSTTSQATNNRASSETLVRGARQDEDNEDSPSQSASAQSKPNSRDITPMTHHSVEGVNGADGGQSSREAKKIMKEQHLFEKMEQAQKKKKRVSGGSTLNTPSIGSSKQLGHLAVSCSVPCTPAASSKSWNFDLGCVQARSGSPNTSASAHPRALESTQRDGKSLNDIAKNPAPLSVDFSMQTDPEPEYSSPNTSAPAKRKPFIPLKQKLLRRCLEDRAASRDGEHRVVKSKSSELLTTEMPPPPAPSRTSSSSAAPSPSSLVDKTSSDGSGDVEMKDSVDAVAETIKRSSSSEQLRPTSSTSPPTENPSQTSHPPLKPPPPPWPSSPPPTDTRQPPKSFRSPDLRVQLPPLPNFSNFSPTTPFLNGNLGSATGAIVQSPFAVAPQAPMFSSAVTSAVTPSPAKKKLSLSDYTRRKKVETPAIEKDKMAVNGSATVPSVFIKSESSLPEEEREEGPSGSSMAELPEGG